MATKPDPKALTKSLNELIRLWVETSQAASGAATACKAVKGQPIAYTFADCGKAIDRLGPSSKKFDAAIKKVETALKSADRKSTIYKLASAQVELAKAKSKEFGAQWHNAMSLWITYDRKLAHIVHK